MNTPRLDTSACPHTMGEMMYAFDRAARAAGWKKADIDKVLTDFYKDEVDRLEEHLNKHCRP